MSESRTPSKLKPASPVARRAVQLCGRGLGVTRPVTVAPTSIISRGTRPRRRIAIAILGCSLLQRCKRWVAADGQGVTGSICGCCKSAFCTRALHEVGDLEQARSTRASQSRLSRFDILGASRRMAVGRATPRRQRARGAPGPRRRRRRRLGRLSRAAETRAKDTSTVRTARSRSGPARTPWTDPGHDIESPASPTGLPVGDDAALCFAHHSQPHRRRNPKHQALRRKRQPPDHVDTVGQRRRYPSRSTAA